MTSVKNDMIKALVCGILKNNDINFGRVYRELRKNPNHPSNIDGHHIKIYNVHNASVKKLAKVMKKVNKVLNHIGHEVVLGSTQYTIYYCRVQQIG